MFERLDPVGSGQILHPASQTMFPNSEITPTRGFEIKVVSAATKAQHPNRGELIKHLARSTIPSSHWRACSALDPTRMAKG